MKRWKQSLIGRQYQYGSKWCRIRKGRLGIGEKEDKFSPNAFEETMTRCILKERHERERGLHYTLIGQIGDEHP